MKTKIAKPENYEAMTPEEKLAFFEGFEYDDSTEVVQKLKDSVSNANSQAAEWKKKHNALLSEEERAKTARDEEFAALKQELEQVKKDKAIADFTAKYTSLGYDADLAASTAKALAEGDAITVFANQATFNDRLKDSVKAELMKETPKPKTGASKDVTKDAFDKMSYSEKVELFNSNPDLYNQLQKN